jgi:aminopeptidase N
MNDASFLRCSRAFHGSGAAPDIKAVLLGKTPRYSPDRSFDTLHVSIDLRLDLARRSATGSCRTRLRAFRDGARMIHFDAVDMKVSGARIEGRSMRFSHKDGKLSIGLPAALRAGEEVLVEVAYALRDPKAGLHFVYPGPHNRKNPVQVWSQSQPEDARCWFPCHDSPRQKATSELRCTVPKGFMAVSNGALCETTRRGRETTYHWRMDHPHSIYLISLAVGKFSKVSDEWDGIPVDYYCERGREQDARRGFGKTPKAMAFFSRMTGVRYPYGKYAQVAVAEYPGGMEHTTCTTQTDACLIDERAALDNDLDLLVAHELAHQWFGDLVTCRDWSHAWLNEGFATYFEVLFQAHDKGQDEADYELYQNAKAYFEEDSSRYRRPIVCETYKYPWILFDRHLYEKGGWVLHMLRHKLGDDLWWKSINHYLLKFRDRSVETVDLVESIEEATGLNPRAFFDRWVFKSGYPQFRVQQDWDPKSGKASLWVLQTQDVSAEAPLFEVPLTFRFSGKGWEKDFTQQIKAKEQRFTFKLPGAPLNVELDPEHRLLKKSSFTKPLEMWLWQLKKSKSGLSRLLAAPHVARWGSDACAAALEAAARKEPFWAAASEMARVLGGMRTEAAFASLKRLLRDRRPKVRRAVVEALAHFDRPETTGLVAPLARRDPSIQVVAQACRTLGAIGGTGVLRLLKKKLKTDSYRQVISAGALGGLAATRDPRQLEALRRASRPPYQFGARSQAIRALADYAPVNREVVAWICEAARDPDERINLMAISILGQLEDERAVPALEKAAKESANTRVKVYAEEALARIRQGVAPKKK